MLPKSGIGMRENPRLFNPSYVDFPVGSLNKGCLSYVRVNNAMLEIGAPPNPGIDSFKKVLNKLSRLGWTQALVQVMPRFQFEVCSLQDTSSIYLSLLTVAHLRRSAFDTLGDDDDDDDEIGTILQWSWPCAKKDKG